MRLQRVRHDLVTEQQQKWSKKLKTPKEFHFNLEKVLLWRIMENYDVTELSRLLYLEK